MLNKNNLLSAIAVTVAVGAMVITAVPGAGAQTLGATNLAPDSSAAPMTNVELTTPYSPTTFQDIIADIGDPNTIGWTGHVTAALIDLRDARGYLNFPDKFNMMDDAWDAVHHVSGAIKDAENLNITDGHREYYTPAETVTLSNADRLYEAKKCIHKAQAELNQVDATQNSTLADLQNETNAADRAVDRATAADDWQQSLTNPSEFNPTGPSYW